MKLLLDTHIWLWSLVDPSRLAKRVVKALQSGEHELWLSPISVWEFWLLVEKKRIAVEGSPGEWLRRAMSAAPLKEAPFTWMVAIEAAGISLPHRVPADRFLIATAGVFGLTLVTNDARLIAQKAVPVFANR